MQPARIASIELRAPLLGLFNRREMYGALPVEVGVFADAGVAWTSERKPGFLGGEREWVRSVGATVRVNVFGYAIGELDYVRPLDRPGRGWMWQFNLTPGFQYGADYGRAAAHFGRPDARHPRSAGRRSSCRSQ